MSGHRFSMLLLAVISLLTWLPVLVAAEAKPFDLQPGDRVVMIGGTFIEREGNYGAIETALTLRNRDKTGITYRNLGWSGDTVWGESRAYFGKREQGYKHLFDLLNELKPTVIFVAYGNNEAFAGEAGKAEFVKQTTKLFTELKQLTSRVVVFSPLDHEGESAQPYNSLLSEYRQLLKQQAEQQQFTWAEFKKPGDKLTYNGLHYDEQGYQQLVDATQITDNKIDWTHPFVIKYRRMIVAKNELFFHRWRPANQTYLFGFRKHEQGQNAKEITQFDPLIAAQETELVEILKSVK